MHVYTVIIQRKIGLARCEVLSRMCDFVKANQDVRASVNARAESRVHQYVMLKRACVTWYMICALVKLS